MKRSEQHELFHFIQILATFLNTDLRNTLKILSFATYYYTSIQLTMKISRHIITKISHQLSELTGNCINYT